VTEQQAPSSEPVDPFSTGGGGTTFEFLVGTIAAVHLALGLPFDGLDGKVPAEVRLQQRNLGHPVDDIIVIAEDGRTRIDIQAKHRITLTPSNREFADSLTQCWQRFCSPDFDTSHHMVAIAYGAHEVSARSLRKVRRLCERARSMSSVDFAQRTQQLNAEQAMHDVIEQILSSTARAPTDDDIYHLLRRLLFLPYDLDSPHSGHRSHMRALIGATDHATDADGVIRSLHSVIADRAAVGGTITGADLEQVLPATLIAALPIARREQTTAHLRAVQDRCDAALSALTAKGKYIPAVVVVERQFRDCSRSFAVPTTGMHLARASLDCTNSRALERIARTMDVPVDNSHPALEMPTEVGARIAAERAISGVVDQLERIRSFRKDASDGKVEARSGKRIPFWKALSLSGPAWKVEEGLGHVLRKLELAAAPVLLITGEAGSGKTFLACDLTSALIARGVPCLLVEAKLLACESDEVLLKELLGSLGPNATPSELVTRASHIARSAGGPLVLIVDGLNEHREAERLATAIRMVAARFVKGDVIKLVMTCRKEFYKQRFKEHLERIEGVQSLRRSEVNYSDDVTYRMIQRHMTHFNICAVWSAIAYARLAASPIVLRVFCEAHKADDGSLVDLGLVELVSGYDVLEQFIERAVEEVVEAMSGQTTSSVLRARTWEVLSRITNKMIESGAYRGCRRDDIEVAIHDHEIVDALLDVEVLLREDLVGSGLASRVELAFSFDEVRDWLLAQQLLEVGRRDQGEVASLIKRVAAPGVPAAEGVLRHYIIGARKLGNGQLSDVCVARSEHREIFLETLREMPDGLITSADLEWAAKTVAADDESRWFVATVAFRVDANVWSKLNATWLIQQVLAGERREVWGDVLASCFRQNNWDHGHGTSAFVPAEVYLGDIADRAQKRSNTEASGVRKTALIMVLLLSELVPGEFSYQADKFMSTWTRRYAADVLSACMWMIRNASEGCSQELWQIAANAMHESGSVDTDILAAALEAYGRGDHVDGYRAEPLIKAAMEIDPESVPVKLRKQVQERDAAVEEWFRRRRR